MDMMAEHAEKRNNKYLYLQDGTNITDVNCDDGLNRKNGKRDGM